MRVTTRQQREALKHVYDRGPVYGPNNNSDGLSHDGSVTKYQRNSYLEFRRTVQYYDDCIMIPWYGMWLGIESDGYTHS